MRKTLTYSSFVIVSLVVVAIFLTATTYTQLGIAIILYPLLVYFAFKLFPRKSLKAPIITVELPAKNEPAPKLEPVEVSDIDKRAFLKLIGAAGISLFLFSLLGRRGESAFFGKAIGTGTVSLEDKNGNKINPAERQPTDGYRISEIDDSTIAYYGFTNKDGAWFIMKEDSGSGSFRYANGVSDFPRNWANHEKLDYDHFYNVF